MGSTMTNRLMTHMRWYRGLAMVLFFGPLAQAQTPSHDLCGNARDLVFIVDQSKTMRANDPDGVRWKLVEYALSLTGKVTPFSDRVAVIPFGGHSETERFIKANYPRPLTPRWYDLAQYPPEQILKNVPRTLSDTTNIFSAFHFFEKYFYEPDSKRDLFIFFVSDGWVDLDPRKDVARDLNERNLQAAHNADLQRILERHGKRWRIYNICLGDSTDDKFHAEMTGRIKITKRASGGLYPNFHGAVNGNPFLLKIDSVKVSAPWPKIASAIASVLTPQTSSRYLPGPFHDNETSAPGLGTVALRLRAFVKPALAARVFENILRVNFVIATTGYKVNLILKNYETIQRGLAVFDFAVDSLHAMKELNRIRKTPEDISSWQIAVHGLNPGQKVERLEVFYEHGWVVHIDKLEIAPDPPEGRSFFRALLDKPEPCKPVLRFHATVQNLCGEKLRDSTAVLQILGDTTYPLKVEQKHRTDDTVGDEYEWRAEIRDSEYLLSKLGETVTVSVFVAGRRFIFETSSVPVKVCAKY